VDQFEEMLALSIAYPDGGRISLMEIVDIMILTTALTMIFCRDTRRRSADDDSLHDVRD
jgi:hypothetical protein